MSDKPPIHPSVIESHAKNKAWNEYIATYFGLNMVKRSMSDYRVIEIWQGSFKVFECHDFQLRPTTNAEMHRKVKAFLQIYVKSLRQFGNFVEDANFKPPSL